MPGKVNPVMAEMLNMAMYYVQGSDLTISLAAQAGQLELNVMMPIIAYEIFGMMQVMIGSITAFTERCVVGIKANREKAEGWLDKNAIVATALTPLIGYTASAVLVKEAVQQGSSIRDVAHRRAVAGELIHSRNGSKVTPEEIDEALKDLRRMTEGGILTK
jgi:fumarate hydratase class II